MVIGQRFLLLAQDQVHDPATSDVRPFASAVVQDFGVGATRFLKGVGKDVHVLKLPLVVNGLGDFRDRAIAPSEPSDVDDDGAKKIAKQVMQGTGLPVSLGI